MIFQAKQLPKLTMLIISGVSSTFLLWRSVKRCIVNNTLQTLYDSVKFLPDILSRVYGLPFVHPALSVMLS